MSFSAELDTWSGSSADTVISVAPQLGARIVSLRDVHDREWIAQARTSQRTQQPGAPFVRPDIGGWDEMVNTIEACTSPLGDTELPDHGDAWTCAWAILKQSTTDLTVSFTSRKLPLQLVRSISMLDDRIELSYRFENMAKSPVPAFWTAHPLIDASDVLSATALSDGAPTLKAVTPLNQPFASTTIPADLEPQTSIKYWADPEGDAIRGFSIERSETRLTMTWDPTEIPYFGLFVDNDEFGPGPVISPQPSIAYYDSAQRASDLGHIQWIEPDQSLSWAMVLRFESTQPTTAGNPRERIT